MGLMNPELLLSRFEPKYIIELKYIIFLYGMGVKILGRGAMVTVKPVKGNKTGRGAC